MAGSANVNKLQLGVPTSNTMSNFTHSSKEWIFLTDPRRTAQLDFMASTIAVSTQCIPMSSKCVDSFALTTQYDTTFDCSKGFKGNFSNPFPIALTNRTVGGVIDEIPYDDSIYDHKSGLLQSLNSMYFARDAAMSSTPPLVNIEGLAPQIEPQNPMHFGAWSMSLDTWSLQQNPGLGNDPELGQAYLNYAIFFLNCTTTVANVSYTWVNGSFHTFDPVPAHPDLAAMVMGPFSHLNFIAQAQTALNNIAALAW